MDTHDEIPGDSEDMSPQPLNSVNGFYEPVAAITVEEQPPLRRRELIAVVLAVFLFRVTVFRGYGFAGYAVLFFVAPFLLSLGSPRPHFNAMCWGVGAMTAILAMKLLWCGSMLLVVCGFALLATFAAILAGMYPYVLGVCIFASQTIQAGYGGLRYYDSCSDRPIAALFRMRWLSVLLPLATLIMFSFLFIYANPDLLKYFGGSIQQILDSIREWITPLSPSAWELVLWVAVLWIFIGLLRPVLQESRPSGKKPTGKTAARVDDGIQSSLYAAFRNMLLTVIVLFAVYLVFEFKTLWFRVFPKGFYYSGYAHEGAAWLTVALALATFILSLVFTGGILRDSRLPKLRKLAWIWSFENFLLAISVCNRLHIYIGFNGMTRMRMVGIFGMTAVVIGFILVIWKIAHNRDFLWLMHRHLWVLALTVYAFALTPIDAIVWQSMLTFPVMELRSYEKGWSTYQIANHIVVDQLGNAGNYLDEYLTDTARRDAALKQFHAYAYQWY